MRSVLISATPRMHKHLVIPGGGRLLHAGDLTGPGLLAEVVACNAFLGSLPHRPKPPRGKALREKWAFVPSGCDVLITHGPPAGGLDFTQAGEHAGCGEPARAVRRGQPQLHVFGHIHGGDGVYPYSSTTFVKASKVNAAYQVVNGPVVFDLAVERGGRVA
jgi:hypothetical protein